MSASAVFELRQYTLHPGQREVLIDVFESELVESQEELGMEVVGQFRDLDRPDRFVWVRGFSDMGARQEALAGFYGGPVWAAHKDVANATMIDFDDVLLLRPLDREHAFPRPPAPRAPVGATDRPRGLVAVTIYRLDAAPDQVLRELFLDRLTPAVALLETEPAVNTYTALPVREGENMVVRFAREPAPASVHDELRPYLSGPPQELRLEPTARSLLR